MSPTIRFRPELTYGYDGERSDTSFPGPDRDQQENISDFVHRGDIHEPTSYLQQDGSQFHNLTSSFLEPQRSRSPAKLRNYLRKRTYDSSMD